MEGCRGVAEFKDEGEKERNRPWSRGNLKLESGSLANWCVYLVANVLNLEEDKGSTEE